jgi:peptide/nickel transport system permease protein
MRSHVLRNAMLPVVTMLGMDVGIWLSNAVFIETVFGLPGVGRLLTRSLIARDLPVVLAITVFVSVLIIVLNAVVDLLYMVLDPRIRAGSADRQPDRPVAARTEPVATPAQQAG